MKKNKKGFTLVELLAVIVVLGIIVAIAAPNLLNARKAANIEEAKQMEKMIEDLGPTIYTDEKISGTFELVKKGDINAIGTYTLKDKGYLKTEDLSIGGETCYAYLLIDDYSSSEPKFEGHICCSGLYRTVGPTSATLNDICSYSYIPSFKPAQNRSNY